MNKTTQNKYNKEVERIQKQLKDLGKPPYDNITGQVEHLTRQIKIAREGQSRLDKIEKESK